jgi:hypothetical protein
VFYQPPRALGLLVGTLLLAWASAIAVLLLNWAFASELSLEAWGAYVGATLATGLGVLIAYWVYGLATLTYALDRNGLVITWAATRQVIPLDAIERLVPGTAVGVPGVRGVSWLGYHVGRADIERVGEVLFYSTHQRPEDVLYVMTSERNYAISVDDPAGFAREIQVRQELGPTTEVQHHVERDAASFEAIWTDRLAQALVALSVLGGLAIWAIIALRYPDLPAQLELTFPPIDRPLIFETIPKTQLLDIPRIATTLLAVNLAIGWILHSWERVAGHVMFAATATLNLGFLAALWVAIGGG